eukprot:TRINITY_DN3148_c1_g4_i1.p1 TRINITY_DN3148_c1_g4~~TRINITY_DN3148_c1_g4_i1.p1  ORF type:complete len:592 (+),score=248.95 TRINITY_DN3148_c1_g4_i1:68-1777(+)
MEPDECSSPEPASPANRASPDPPAAWRSPGSGTRSRTPPSAAASPPTAELGQQQAAVRRDAAVHHAEAALVDSAAELAAEQQSQRLLAVPAREAASASEDCGQAETEEEAEAEAEAELHDVLQRMREAEQELRAEEEEVNMIEQRVVEAAEHGMEMVNRRQRLQKRLDEARAARERIEACAADEAAQMEETLHAATQRINPNLAKYKRERDGWEALQPQLREYERLSAENEQLEREVKRRRSIKEDADAQDWAHAWNQLYYDEKVEALRQHWAKEEQQQLVEPRHALAAAQKRLQQATEERDNHELEIIRIRKDRAARLASLQKERERWKEQWAADWAAREAEKDQAIEAARAEWEREERFMRDQHAGAMQTLQQRLERAQKESLPLQARAAVRLAEKEAADAIAEAQARHQQLLGDSQARVAALEDKRKEARQALRTMQHAHPAEMAELQRRTEAAVAAERARHRTELAKVRRAKPTQEQSEAERLAAEGSRRRAREQGEFLDDADHLAELQRLIDERHALTRKRDLQQKEREAMAARLTAAESHRDALAAAARQGGGAASRPSQRAR